MLSSSLALCSIHLMVLRRARRHADVIEDWDQSFARTFHFSLSIATTFCMFEYENAAARGRTFDVAAADCDDGRAEIDLHDAGVSVEF